MTDQDTNIVMLIKGGHRYVIMFVDYDKATALRTIGRWAANPDLNFTWYNAAQLGKRIRAVGTEVRTMNILTWTPTICALPTDGQAVCWHGPHGETVEGYYFADQAGRGEWRRADTGEVVDYVPSAWRARG